MKKGNLAGRTRNNWISAGAECLKNSIVKGELCHLLPFCQHSRKVKRSCWRKSWLLGGPESSARRESIGQKWRRGWPSSPLTVLEKSDKRNSEIHEIIHSQSISSHFKQVQLLRTQQRLWPQSPMTVFSSLFTPAVGKCYFVDFFPDGYYGRKAQNATRSS